MVEDAGQESEPPHNVPYLSVFIDHFLTGPAENCGTLKLLYLDFDLSIREIVELTESQWSKSAITRALGKHSISKEKKASHAQYGQQIVQGIPISKAKKQRVVQLMLARRKAGDSLAQIARHLNDKKIKSHSGSTWSPATIQRIIKREQMGTST